MEEVGFAPGASLHDSVNQQIGVPQDEGSVVAGAGTAADVADHAPADEPPAAAQPANAAVDEAAVEVPPDEDVPMSEDHPAGEAPAEEEEEGSLTNISRQPPHLADDGKL